MTSHDNYGKWKFMSKFIPMFKPCHTDPLHQKSTMHGIYLVDVSISIVYTEICTEICTDPQVSLQYLDFVIVFVRGTPCEVEKVHLQGSH